ncbi:MAG: N-succinylarginine dihydrolase [Alphaproteobacteria bacterium]|nr:MAG: N-succinylarginine dihydrolase [Alphaproteobacteria bacterium]
MTAIEVNFDGLVGPTHNYGGLAQGNLAAAANEGKVSNPREAALQGLGKMRTLMRMGLTQGVLPPHERPHVASLRKMGFAGRDADVVATAMRASPVLLANVSSASAMWTANAATVSPSADTGDGRVHFTPASLSSHFHRAMETETTSRVLSAIFADRAKFEIHPAVPFATFGDEGAANHCRLSSSHGERGIELFVYGRSAFAKSEGERFSARQAMEASHIVAMQHQLWSGGGALLVKQSQKAIDAGAFHNDVVAVLNGNVLMFHAQAFEQRDTFVESLVRASEARGFSPVLLEAGGDELSLDEAVKSYLFNSQIVTLPAGGMALILPSEAEETPRAKAFVDRVLASNGPVREAHYLDLRQSMRNGGGPACLRLRVVLTGDELAALDGRALLDDARLAALEEIVRRRYRDRLAIADLADPALLDESRTALDEIGQVLGLGAVHDFQRV